MPAAHVLTILAVADLARSASFYHTAFGWDRTVDESRYVEFALPAGMRLGLYDRESFARNTGAAPPIPGENSTTSTELYLHVDDVDSAVRRVVAAGARLLSGAENRPWGDVAAYLADPDGNVVVVAKQLDDARDHAAVLRTLAHRWMTLWQGADLSLVDELHAPDFIDHGAVGRRPDRVGVRDGILELRREFPDFHAVTEDLLVDLSSPKVVVRWTATGTQRGGSPPLPASDRVVSFRGIEILHVLKGRIAERWGEWDLSGWIEDASLRPDGQGP